MTRFIFLFFASVTSLGTQIIEPVEWTNDIEKIDQNRYLVTFDAQIDEGWHLYSQFSDANGALPTEFIFLNTSGNYQSMGPVKESESIVDFDKVFQMDLTFFKNQATFQTEIEVINPDLNYFEIEVNYQVCDDTLCIFRSEIFDFILNVDFIKAASVLDEHSRLKSQEMLIDLKNKHFLNQKMETADRDYWTIFFLGLFGGVLALLTPCILPMIPLTVSYFLNSSKTATKGIMNGLIYGFFIIIIYVLLSLPFHLFDSLNPEILNSLATNVTLNLIFFAVFIVFALSFFGLFDITLPSRWVSKTDKLSSMGNIVGIFFMALTLAVVSFSCTGPLLGSLLAGSITSQTGATQLTFGMLGFGTALGLPFAFFAIFPKTIHWVPKSGGWMSVVKVTLGFLELALALKFLSNADLVAHWGILKREIFIATWLLLALLLTLYLFGAFQSKTLWSKKINPGRFFVGIVALFFCVYLSRDFFSKENTLQFLSGFPPPEFYSIKKVENQCPLDLRCFKDYQTGLEFAKKEKKPVLVDFTGWACINCRKMEENVWAHSDVYPLLQQFVIVSLYVDDRMKLPESERFNFQYEDGRVRDINTVGKKWSTFQYVNFNHASQPFYIQLSPDEELLNSPIQYTNVPSFRNWLEKGMTEFEKKSVFMIK
ncbi:MAG: thioredoxin family protein [Flavobacteriaceae bacterium]|nr:thioredoxin family protein [Flavobacteriaceae bacterium]